MPNEVDISMVTVDGRALPKPRLMLSSGFGSRGFGSGSSDYGSSYSGSGSDYSSDYSGSGSDYGSGYSGSGSDYGSSYSGSESDYGSGYSGSGSDYGSGSISGEPYSGYGYPDYGSGYSGSDQSPDSGSGEPYSGYGYSGYGFDPNPEFVMIVAEYVVTYTVRDCGVGTGPMSGYYDGPFTPPFTVRVDNEQVGACSLHEYAGNMMVAQLTSLT